MYTKTIRYTFGVTILIYFPLPLGTSKYGNRMIKL